MKKFYSALSFLFLMSVFAPFAVADDVFECEFKPGKWNKNDFISVKSSRWPNINGFNQELDHIVNSCPKDATKEDMLSKRCGETYAAMIYKVPLKGNHEVKAEMSFDYRMAPSIVIADKPGKDKNGYPEFRTHYEIVLYDQGVNVWRHTFKNGKQVWKKMAAFKATFQPNRKYEMEVDVDFTLVGPRMSVSVGKHKVTFRDDMIPKEYYAGIIASEGVNRFYEFEID